MTRYALRTVLLSLAALLLLAILVMQVRTVYGDPPPPVYEEADSCSQLAPAGETWHEFRIDDPEAAAYSNGYLAVDLDILGGEGQVEFSWQTNVPIDAVYAAGGPGGNLYQYVPPGPPETGDEGLHTPYNGSGRRYYSLSMILFCATSPLQPTPTAPPTASPLPTATATATASPTNTPGPPTFTPTATATLRPGETPAPTATPAPTETQVPPPTGPRFFPLAFSFGHVGEEPNDDCRSAYRIGTNSAYQFLPDDQHDWFTFALAEPADVTVTLADFSPLAGQIAAYRGASCSSSQLLGNNGDTTSTKVLDLGRQPAGRYFLYVSNDGVLSATEPYTLIVTTQP